MGSRGSSNIYKFGDTGFHRLKDLIHLDLFHAIVSHDGAGFFPAETAGLLLADHLMIGPVGTVSAGVGGAENGDGRDTNASSKMERARIATYHQGRVSEQGDGFLNGCLGCDPGFLRH